MMPHVNSAQRQLRAAVAGYQRTTMVLPHLMYSAKRVNFAIVAIKQECQEETTQ